jgi:hypothetical protein
LVTSPRRPAARGRWGGAGNAGELVAGSTGGES